jgi:hypothetical protein
LFKLSAMRLNALMINRLYHVSTSEQEMKDLVEAIDKRAGTKSDKLKRRPNGDIAVGVPTFLGW